MKKSRAAKPGILFVRVKPNGPGKIPFIGLLAALMVFGAGKASAQEETPAKVKVYGFINNYAVFDSRQVDAGTEDLFFFMPKDVKMSGEVDQNAVPSFRMLSLTTRLGLNISGYQFGETKVSGTIEGDFYCMSGSTAIARLRQAYMGILWDNLVLGDLLLNVGQTWHPMAVDMPHVNNVEMGSPFNPFNWSPQIMANWTVRKFTWTGGILFPMQFQPTGPEGKSIDYNRFGMIPEVYWGYLSSRAVSWARPVWTCSPASRDGWRRSSPKYLSMTGR